MIRKILFCMCMLSSVVLMSCASQPQNQDEDEILGDDSAAVTNETSKTTDSAASPENASEDATEQGLDDVAKTDVAKPDVATSPQDDDFADFEKDSDAAAAEVTPVAPVTPVVPVPEPQPQQSAAPEVARNKQTEITNIGYLANDNGGSVLIETSEPIQYTKRLNNENNQLIIEIPGAHLPDRLKRPYIMKEFSGRFGAINAYQGVDGGAARIVVQMKGPDSNIEPVVQQEGNQLIILPVSPAAAKEVADSNDETEEKNDGNTFTGRKQLTLSASNLDGFLTNDQKFYGTEISIQTKDADVRDVLNFIADQSGLNMIISDDVQGKVSLKLRKIPWDQALLTVMRAKSLGYTRQGDVIRISTLVSLKTESEEASKMIEFQKAAKPLKIKVIPVNYASVSDLAESVKKVLTKTGGEVASDKQTSSLIVTANEDVLDRITALIKDLDIPTPQVMIEGKIIEATNQFQRSVGINWNFSGAATTLSQGGGLNGSPITLNPQLSVQPVTNAGGNPLNLSLQLGTLDVIGSLTAQLSLLEIDNTAKVLSSPRVVTMNKQKATIKQSTENITVTNSVTGTTVTPTVTRTPVTLELTVTPQITADGSVIMDMDVQRQFLDSPVPGTTGAAPIETRSASTKILVRSGQTAVIGGIYANNETVGETGVPVLRNIPILGWLFKSRNNSTLKNELLIFLTPRILASPKDLEPTENLGKTTS